MLTFLTAPKPFRGHIGIIQRNAIQSWKAVHPDAKVIVFGDEEGCAEATRDLGICHTPHVKRNSFGTPCLSSILEEAQELTRNSILCYVNCDIILLSDFRAAAKSVIELGGRFLMAGQRWDADITTPVDFYASDWEATVRRLALETNHRRPPRYIDYFVFSRGLYGQETPPLAIGRAGFDNWMLWYARHAGARVIDASQMVIAIHQNHDYSHHSEGEKGIYDGVEARQNYAYMLGGRYATLENATHRLTPDGLRPNYYRWVVVAKRRATRLWNAVWFGLLGLTRPLRHRLGLRERRAAATPVKSK